MSILLSSFEDVIETDLKQEVNFPQAFRLYLTDKSLDKDDSNIDIKDDSSIIKSKYY